MSRVRPVGLLLSAVALLLALQAPHLADAREFRAADIQEEGYPTVQALRFTSGQPARQAKVPQVAGGALRLERCH